MARSSFAVLALAATSAHCDTLNNHANPIRKVVTLLQNLKTKVENEGAKEREIHEKYMCYCKNGAASLEKSVADAGSRVSELESAIKEAEAKKAGLDSAIAGHRSDQVAAKTAMAEATALREKQKAAFDHATAEAQAELGPIDEALALLSHGEAPVEGNVTGNATGNATGNVTTVTSFLQSSGAQVLKKVVQSQNNMNDGDRSELISFLAADSEYAPANSEIVGILQGLKDQVLADVADVTKEEDENIASYEKLMEAQKQELAPIQALLEEKLVRAGEVPVEIVQLKNDLGDSGEQIVEDKKFLADLGKNCATKEKFWEENVKMRGQEIQALADTIKVLNDDDALELFKKTLPGASSFVQISETTTDMRARAVSALAKIKTNNVGVDFIVLSLHGKKAGSDKVVKLIDNLLAALKKEGRDDADKKVYCAKQFDESDDKKKALEKEVADHEATIADLETVPQQLTEEIDALGDGIRELDKNVADATAQRKEEADDYGVLMANDAAAKELILFAKNRLNKFYNPKLYKPTGRDLTDEDRATLAAGGTVALAQQLPPPPAAVEAYSKKSEESGGVIALMDLLVKDLDKEMLEAKMTEKNAQEDYGNFMNDAAAKRSKDAQALTDKEGTLADTKARLSEVKEAKASSEKNLMAVEQYIGDLHSECDWLIKYFDMRQEARNNEINGLTNAKAVLRGADYSFLQTKTFLHK